MMMWPNLACKLVTTIIHLENKATCSSVSAEYDQIFGQSETESKFGIETTVSQAI